MQPEINQLEGYFAPLKKVTPLSKYLALSLFIILPFVGGWIGYSLAPEKVIEVEKVVEPQEAISLNTETNIQDIQANSKEVLEKVIQPGWNLYTDEFEGYSYQYPASWVNNTEPTSPNSFSYVSDIDSTTLKQDREVPVDSFSVLSEFADCQFAVKPITFAGKNAMEAPWGPAMVEEWRYICFDDGMAILLTADFDDNQKEVLETILSTFKFTEKAIGSGQ